MLLHINPFHFNVGYSYYKGAYTFEWWNVLHCILKCGHFLLVFYSFIRFLIRLTTVVLIRCVLYRPTLKKAPISTQKGNSKHALPDPKLAFRRYFMVRDRKEKMARKGKRQTDRFGTNRNGVGWIEKLQHAAICLMWVWVRQKKRNEEENGGRKKEFEKRLLRSCSCTQFTALT